MWFLHCIYVYLSLLCFSHNSVYSMFYRIGFWLEDKSWLQMEDLQLISNIKKLNFSVEHCHHAQEIKVKINVNTFSSAEQTNFKYWSDLSCLFILCLLSCQTSVNIPSNLDSSTYIVIYIYIHMYISPVSNSIPHYLSFLT